MTDPCVDRIPTSTLNLDRQNIDPISRPPPAFSASDTNGRDPHGSLGPPLSRRMLLSLINLFAAMWCLAGCIIDPTDDVEEYKNQRTGWCLQDGESGIAMGDCSDWNNRRWEVRVLADGDPRKVELKNAATKRCLEDSTQYGLYTTACNPARRQSWLVTRWSNGTIELKNQETQMCVEASGTDGLSSKNCDRSEAQGWL
jgi:hypothetical protein